MKRILILFVILLTQMLFSGDFDDKGLISDWKFSPLQVDVGLIEHKKLVDESTNTFFSFGLFILEQKSAIISYALIASRLENNYGVQIPPLILGSVTDNNYGISFGWENYSKKCYGIQGGILNHSWAGDPVEINRKRVQFCGLNIADFVYIGLVNMSNRFQIGVVNLSPGATFQLGLINYNPRSYIPWLPLVNWDMGREEK